VTPSQVFALRPTASGSYRVAWAGQVRLVEAVPSFEDTLGLAFTLLVQSSGLGAAARQPDALGLG
jgi:hypothetical protein